MTAYYNEIDPYCAAWLRNLIKAGHLPAGEVDERDIRAVRATELAGYRQCHFFAGIGGWAYAARLAGWPDDRPIWTGSCPCQPFSVAGQRRGVADERHLWPEMYRLISECKPAIVFGEQVASSDGRKWLAGIRTDLEALGYGVGAADLCAASAGAPHIRQRLFWVADMHISGLEERQEQPTRQELATAERSGDVERMEFSEGEQVGISGFTRQQRDTSIRLVYSDSDRTQRTRGEEFIVDATGSWSNFDIVNCADGKARRIESGSFPLAHGVPGRVGRLRAYGNAIVPQVAAEVIKATMLG